MQKKNTQSYKKVFISNESLEHVSFKLISKKEIVTNKEYEKQLLKKKAYRNTKMN